MATHEIQKADETSLVPMIIYILYLLGLVLPIAALIGLILAYVNRNGVDSWVQSHYRVQISTFWWGLFWIVLGSIFTIFIIGYFVLIGFSIWLIVRCIKGINCANRCEAYG
jgi:uncharacterized membrane protein